MTENKTLKPCPFCGSSVIEMNEIKCTGEVYIECRKCHIEFPLYPTYNDAIEAWNIRAEANGWIKCSERLPRCDENPVLVSTKEMVNIGWYSCGKWETGTRLPMKDVIAWQPLPEPARLEGE